MDKLRKYGINIDDDCPTYHKRRRKFSIIYLEDVIWFIIFGQLLIVIALILLIQVVILLIGMTIFGSRRIATRKFSHCYQKTFLLFELFRIIVII